jgi:hypothetical protein
VKFKALGDSGFHTLKFKDDGKGQSALFDEVDNGFSFNLNGFISRKKARALAEAILKKTER